MIQNKHSDTPENPTCLKPLLADSAVVFKKCTCCNLQYPKTTDYFLIKSKSNDYKWKVNEIYRSICKKCHYEKCAENQIIKRCKELNIKRSDWIKWKRINLMKNPIFKLKDESLKDLKRPLRARILKKIREENYIFTSIENYYNECAENRSKAQRKYEYEEKIIDYKIISEKMPDYYVANRLKKSIKEIPKEVIETKRLVIQLKRELKKQKL